MLAWPRKPRSTSKQPPLPTPPRPRRSTHNRPTTCTRRMPAIARLPQRTAPSPTTARWLCSNLPLRCHPRTTPVCLSPICTTSKRCGRGSEHPQWNSSKAASPRRSRGWPAISTRMRRSGSSRARRIIHHPRMAWLAWTRRLAAKEAEEGAALNSKGERIGTSSGTWRSGPSKKDSWVTTRARGIEVDVPESTIPNTRWRGRIAPSPRLSFSVYLRTPPPPFSQAVAVQFRVNDAGEEIVIARDLYSLVLLPMSITSFPSRRRGGLVLLPLPRKV